MLWNGSRVSEEKEGVEQTGHEKGLIEGQEER